MVKNKKIWKLFLLIGFIPFIIPILYGTFNSISGFSSLCILNCSKDYGISAFFDSILLYSYILWPTYIIGIILLIISVLKIRKNK